MHTQRMHTATPLLMISPPLTSRLCFACTNSVEGGERLVLKTIDWSLISVGVLVVEMRYNDATNNREIFSLLRAAGFELVRSLAVWHEKIIDNVFIRAEHFLFAPDDLIAETTIIPKLSNVTIPTAVYNLLASLPRERPKGANRALLHGRHCCVPYTTKMPLSMAQCSGPDKGKPILAGTPGSPGGQIVWC